MMNNDIPSYIRKSGNLQTQRMIVDIDSAFKNWFKQVGYDIQRLESHSNFFGATRLKILLRPITKEEESSLRQQIGKDIPICLDSITPYRDYTVVQFTIYWKSYERFSPVPFEGDDELLKAFIEKYGG